MQTEAAWHVADTGADSETSERLPRVWISKETHEISSRDRRARVRIPALLLAQHETLDN